MKPHSHDVGVARAFDCFCKKVLRNEARDYQDALPRKRNREVYFSELPVEVLEQFAVRDTYFTDSRTFEVIGHSVCIDDETLAEAINAVLKHYAGYIARLSMRELYDEYGNPHLCVDEELRRRLETKLITKLLTFRVR